jgi:hypothetical protein
LLGGFAVVGGVRLCRNGRGDLVALAAVPLGLNLLAGCCHVYPFAAVRLVAHAIPGLALLIGAGVKPTVTWLAERWRMPAMLPVATIVMPLGLSIYHVAVPWFRADSATAVKYVLNRRDQFEPVLANFPECEYYCRDLGDRFHYIAAANELPDRRTWIVLEAFDSSIRESLFKSIVGQRRVLERRDFNGLTAARLDSIVTEPVASVD